MNKLVRLTASAASLIAALVILLSAGLPPRSGILVRPGETPIAAEVGAIAPPFDKIDIRNRRLSLSALRGAPVVINFWATWCAPCVSEMPRLQDSYDRYKPAGLRMIGINVNEPVTDVLTWAQHFHITYDLVVDNDGRLSYQYMVRNLPMTLFIGRDGLIRQIVYGEVSDSRLTAELTALLND
ncbi:MAG: TlpA family protein disulfide reductase [Anaerolineae bacterium]|nr:TlpA family protein disulfide reductase [Anaerolineae bacterium]